jgi:hypothetical protein
LTELDEQKVREGAKKVIEMTHKFEQLINEMQSLADELSEKVPISPKDGARAAEIVIEEIEKSDLNPIQKELIKASVMSAWINKTSSYVR